MTPSPHCASASARDRCSHIAMQFRSLRWFGRKAWQECGVTSKATRELFLGAIVAAGHNRSASELS